MSNHHDFGPGHDVGQGIVTEKNNNNYSNQPMFGQGIATQKN